MRIIRRKYNIYYYHAINTEYVVNFYVLEFFKNKFYMSVMPPCVSHECPVSAELRRGHWIP